MRACLILITYLLFTSFSPTLVRCKSIAELICYSDNILVGKITSLTDSTYTVEVEEDIKGKIGMPLVLPKDKGSAHHFCRWSEYKKGQTELVFLQYDKEFKEWSLTASSAEMPINDSLVYVYSNGWVLEKNAERWGSAKYYNLDSNYFSATAFNKREMISAIKDFNKDAKKIIKLLRQEKDMKYFLSNAYPYPKDIVMEHKFLKAFQSRSKSHLRILNELMDEPNLMPWPGDIKNRR